MVKLRMSTADVAAEVKCLRSLIGMRCSNIYDLSPKMYVFKLMNSSGITGTGESEKVLLLMESGVRLHTTAYFREKSNTPSGFTLKLRKHLRTRRLEDVRQLGYDRIVILQFGIGANAHHVILELYSQGNILLTDSEFTVLTLLRSHRDDDKGFSIMSRHRYPTESCRVFEQMTIEKLKAICNHHEQQENHTKEAANNVAEELLTNAKSGKRSVGGLSCRRSNRITLKKVLGESLGYGPAIAEHIILDAGKVPNEKFNKDMILDNDMINAIAKFEDWLQSIISGENIPDGYILLHRKNSGKEIELSESLSSSQVYEEFCPILLNQFKTKEFVKFPTFDAAVDEFYSKYEGQRIEQQQKAKEDSAVQKINKIRLDQENRIQKLREDVDCCARMGKLIEYNLKDVDDAILAVRVALAKGMSWLDIDDLVKEEKKLGNPVAGLIDKLQLERHCITLTLSNKLDEMDCTDKALPTDKVEVDLSLSAHANACRWYDMKKKQESKQEKTSLAHDKALKAAEKKTRLQIAQEKSVASISHMRKVHWFEKFNWFISSENYLVISGRDAQQNEMIVKRYMSKSDIYVHADLHGASSTVIRNHKQGQSIPPLTLNQAGCFTVCHSQAWDSKIVTSAWWVHPHQVSKTAPTGEYLTAGSFMIRGKKNFLPPHPLLMGFGLLFCLDESSLGLHLNERKIRGDEKTDTRMEGLPPTVSGLGEHFTAKLSLQSDDRVSQFASTPSLHDIVQEWACTANDESMTAPYQCTSSISLLPSCDDHDLQPHAKSVSSFGSESSQFDHAQERSNGRQMGARDRPHLSKAERRKLNKAKKNGHDPDKKDVKMSDDDNGKITNNSTIKVVEKKISNDTSKKISCLQHGKLKKMKKYADQDEEERCIRMALLASGGNAQKKVSKQGIVETVDNGENDSESQEAVKVCYNCKKKGHLSQDCPTSAINDINTNCVEDRVTMEEEGIHEIGEQEKERLHEIDYLTGNPLHNDILLYVVPVCGPLAALQPYKYRVKLTPGTLKKGKAVKTAMNLFSHMTEATRREKELMKACTEPELVATIVGNVKVSAPGLTQLKKKPKRDQKK